MRVNMILLLSVVSLVLIGATKDLTTHKSNRGDILCNSITIVDSEGNQLKLTANDNVLDRLDLKWIGTSRAVQNLQDSLRILTHTYDLKIDSINNVFDRLDFKIDQLERRNNSKIENFEDSLEDLNDIFYAYKNKTNRDLRVLSKSVSHFNDLESDFDSIDIENLKNVDIEKLAKKFKKK